MENPITRVCRERNLSRAQLSILGDCDRSKIAQIESGAAKTIKGKLLDAIVEIGYDRGEIIQQYAEWRRSMANEIKAQLVTA